MRTARAAVSLTWEATSANIRRGPSLMTAIVTHLVTRSCSPLAAALTISLGSGWRRASDQRTACRRPSQAVRECLLGTGCYSYVGHATGNIVKTPRRPASPGGQPAADDLPRHRGQDTEHCACQRLLLLRGNQHPHSGRTGRSPRPRTGRQCAVIRRAESTVKVTLTSESFRRASSAFVTGYLARVQFRLS
jgi:hypothetical protein